MVPEPLLDVTMRCLTLLITIGSPASPPPRPESRDDASSSSSGSTTLSATSSPGGVAGNLSGCEDNNIDMKSNNMPEQISSLEVILPLHFSKVGLVASAFAS